MMSQQGPIEEEVGNIGVETLTGNIGGPISPDGVGNINVIGAAPYSVSGNPGTFTLTITDDGTIATTYTADTGTATPSSNNLNIIGTSSQGITTSGATDTITITADDATTTQKGVIETSTDAESIAGAATNVAVTPASLNAKLGVQTADGIAYGIGSTSSLAWTAGLTDGQIAIGSTAGVPAAGNITSTGGTITVTNGANTINIETDETIASSFPTDGGTATPSSGALTIAGGTGITTSGAASTVTIDLDSPVSVTNGGTGATTLTGVLTGNGTSPITANAVTQYTVLLGGASNAVSEVSGVGTSGQVLTSNGAGMDPTWQDAATGDVTGPVSSTDNALARWNGTGGDTLQNSTVIVTDNGEMTNASQPAFYAAVNTTIPNVTGDGTIYTIVYDTEVFDQNGDFDGTSTFTAPVTGRYQLSAGVQLLGTSISAAQFGINISNVGIKMFPPNSAQDTSRCQGNLSGLLDLDAADTATVFVLSTDSGGKIDDVLGINTTYRAYFTGSLIC